MKTLFKNIGLILFCGTFLLLTVRGRLGNPNENSFRQQKWLEEGPFELSPERGRFALTYSLVEDKSVYFNPELARFVLPDLGYSNGHYVSIFAPGVSLATLPGYLIGKILGASQIGTYLTISLFALMNALLVKKISKLLGANEIAAVVSALIFLFATPAFSYAVNLYQHHISTFLILFSVLLLLKKIELRTSLIVMFLYGVSFVVDYPNLILMLPLVIFSFRNTILVLIQKLNVRVRLDLRRIVSIFALAPALILLACYNSASYSSPFQLSGTVETVKEMDARGQPIFINSGVEKVGQTADSAINFFRTRNIVNGLYVLGLSPDRGIIYFAPIVLFAIVGVVDFGEKKKEFAVLLASILGVNFLLYSMWGDPWGGWAFGSRYLIPTYAISSILISIAITKFRKDILFMVIFSVTILYSTLVNSLGALTTSANPPRIEAENLSSLSGREEEYTFKRNFDFLLEKGSKSFIYQEFLSKILTPLQYYLLISGSLISIMISFSIYLHLAPGKSAIEFVLKTKSTGGAIKLTWFVEKIKVPRVLWRNKQLV